MSQSEGVKEGEQAGWEREGAQGVGVADAAGEAGFVEQCRAGAGSVHLLGHC